MAEFSFQAFILRAQAHVDICDSAYQRLESGIQQALPVMQKAKQAEAAMREVVRWPGRPHLPAAHRSRACRPRSLHAEIDAEFAAEAHTPSTDHAAARPKRGRGPTVKTLPKAAVRRASSPGRGPLKSLRAEARRARGVDL